jgi:hypothetical protein
LVELLAEAARFWGDLVNHCASQKDIMGRVRLSQTVVGAFFWTDDAKASRLPGARL